MNESTVIRIEDSAAEGIMSTMLQVRVKEFLQRPIPAGMPYLPGSLSEQILGAYATNGTVQLDSEWTEILAICVVEASNAAASKAGEEGAYYRETSELLRAIQLEVKGK
jgi:hypothetical protein